MSTTTTTTEPRIYVGTYGKYNSGSIAGAWIDLEGHNKESFYAACRDLHKDETDPEFMFQDFEGFPREFYGESGCDAELWEWLVLDENDRELLSRYVDAIGSDGLTIEDARDAFYGTTDNLAEFAENLANKSGSIPKDFPTWIVIDWEASWNCNLRHDFVTSESENGELYFFNRK
jgi:antirestriction protein